MRDRFTDEQIDAMGTQAGALLAEAEASGDLGIVMAPYAGPPARAEFFLDMLKEMIETTGEATGCVTVGCGDYSGIVPINHSVQTVLTALLAARQFEAIPPVDWVTVAMDTYRLKEVDGVEPEPGAATEAFLRGDPNAEEAIVALCYAPDGPSYDVTVPYTRTPTGIEWREAEPHPHESGGAVIDLMHALVNVRTQEKETP